MTTGIAGLKAGNAIVPYEPVARQTKEVDVSSFVDTLASGSVSQFKATAYSDSDGNWTVDFYGNGAKTNNITQQVITFDSGTFKFDTAVSPPIDSFNTVNQLAYVSGVEQLSCGANPASYASWVISGKGIPLTGEPTWADANLETRGADQYIAPASDTVAGLVKLQSQDTWVLTNDQPSGNQDPLGPSSDWERYTPIECAGQYGANLITESSGIFSFIETGHYRIDWFGFLISSAAVLSAGIQLAATDDDSSYGVVSYSAASLYASSAAGNISGSTTLDITNIANDKFKFIYLGANALVRGDTSRKETYFIITKLGE